MKKLVKLSLCFLLGGLLTACGSSDKEGAGNSGDNKGGKATITYAIWDKNQEAGMKASAEAFMKENDTIKVKVEVTPWKEYWTKLDAAATGGNLPDVFWMHSNEVYRYMSNEMLMDLTDLTTEGNVDLANYPEDIGKLYSYEEKQYAIPKDFDTIGLWYNKALFDEKGVAYPDESWTWQDLVEAGKKLTDESKNVYGVGARKDFQEGYYSFIFQNGGKVLADDLKSSKFDDPKTIEALDFYAAMSTKEKISPTADKFEETTAGDMFGSGMIAMGFFGSWMVPEFLQNDYIVENCDVAVLPQGTQRASIYNGLGNAVSQNTKNKEAAIKFVEYLSSKEAMATQAEYASAIPAYKGVSEGWIKNTEPFNTQVYIDMLDYSVILPYCSQTVAMGDIELAELTGLFSGEISAEKACKEVAKKVDELLATE